MPRLQTMYAVSVLIPLGGGGEGGRLPGTWTITNFDVFFQTFSLHNTHPNLPHYQLLKMAQKRRDEERRKAKEEEKSVSALAASARL